MNLYLPITRTVRFKLFHICFTSFLTVVSTHFLGFTPYFLMLPGGFWVFALLGMIGVISCGMLVSIVLNGMPFVGKLIMAIICGYFFGLFDPFAPWQVILIQCIPISFLFLGVYLDHSYVKFREKITQQEDKAVDSIGS